jgi:hypothetical protein
MPPQRPTANSKSLETRTSYETGVSGQFCLHLRGSMWVVFHMSDPMFDTRFECMVFKSRRLELWTHFI